MSGLDLPYATLAQSDVGEHSGVGQHLRRTHCLTLIFKEIDIVLGKPKAVLGPSSNRAQLPAVCLRIVTWSF